MDNELKREIEGGTSSLGKIPEDVLKKREEEKKKRMEELKMLSEKLQKDES